MEIALKIYLQSSWFILHRFRLVMQTGSFLKLAGEGEVDETYIGGKARNMHAHKRKHKIKGRGRDTTNKTAIVGMRDRSGKGRAEVVPNVKRHTIPPRVRATVDPT